MWLSIVIPAYNEEKRIKNTVFKIGDYLAKQNYDYEIIVVNDGSIDKTADVVEEMKLRVANLVIINNQKNHGKGFVVRQGLLNSRGEYRLFLDADGSTSIEEIEKFLPHIKQGHDIVIASRAINGANIISAQHWSRKILGGIYRLVTKLFSGLWGFYDTQCGFKLFSAKSVKDVFSRCKINGWSFDVEALLIAVKLGYSIKEVPINWSDSPGTKVNIKGMIKAVFDLLKIRWYVIGISRIKSNKN